ncbi:MAG: response regulator [Gammaproteobacteria bacterium]
MIPVLLIDDDQVLASLLSQYMLREGFAAHAVHDGATGVVEATSGRYAAVVLDIMMPRLSGIDALRRIRERSNVPVLMLTAKGDNVDRVIGLDMGADDYVPKPCTPSELTARIRAVLRRAGSREAGATADAPPVIEAGHLRLWRAARRAQWKGSPLVLTGTEFSLLEALARRAGRLVGKEDISLQVFGKPLARFDRRIDVHISSIRQKLGLRGDGTPWILSVRGQGYQLLVDE